MKAKLRQGGGDLMAELEVLARPLVEYLRKNYHPHTAIVVTDERVVVVEDVVSVPVKKVGEDQ